MIESEDINLEKLAEQLGGELPEEKTLSPDDFEKLAESVEGKDDRIAKEVDAMPLTEEEKQKSWEDFMRKIKAHEVTEALINRSLEWYKSEYDQKNSDEPINFKLYLRPNRQLKKGIIFDVSLILEMTRGGKIYKLSEKRISFTRVREIKDEAGWKFQLYQSMLDSLVTNAINFYILKKDADSGRIRSEVPPIAS